MRNVPRTYKGFEITPEIISEFKIICEGRYDPVIFEEYFGNVHTIQQLSRMHDNHPEDETLILGDDWFIMYADKEYIVEVLEWVALDNVENKMSQIIEMLNALKYILYLSKKKCIESYLRQDTSYKFYQLGIKRGIIKPAIDEAVIDCAIPDDMENTMDYLKEKHGTIENFIQSPELKDYSDYETYILHRVAFTVTKEFVKQYKKSQKKKS